MSKEEADRLLLFKQIGEIASSRDVIQGAVWEAIKKLQSQEITRQIINDASEFCQSTSLTPWAEQTLEPKAEAIRQRYECGEREAFHLVVQIIRLIGEQSSNG